nr:hypothetical protein [Tanacetum cinerariifolium]
MEQLFYAKMDNIKYINVEAYEYLVQRNPNTWCRAFFNLDVKCAAFENGYMHLNRDPDEGVHHYYSQEMLARVYQYSFRPISGTNLWKRTNNQPPLPHIVRKMHEIPNKNRVKATGENNSQVIRPSRRREPTIQNASARGGGRGTRGGGRGAVGAESRGIGAMGAESEGRGVMSGGRGADSGGKTSMGGGRGRRGGDRGRRGCGRGSTSGLKLIDEDDIRKSMEHDYLQGLLDEQEDQRQKEEKEHQKKLDEEAFQQAMEE